MNKKFKLVLPIVLLAILGWYFNQNIYNLIARPYQPLPPKIIVIDSSKTKKLSLFIGGDMLLGDASESILENKGYDFPFKKVSSLIRNADIASVNLEAPICDKAPIQHKYKKYKYRQPGFVADLLKEQGFDLLYLANNHTNDYTHEGLTETIQFIDNAGMLHMGGGINQAEAHRGILLVKGNVKVGILNYMSYRKHYDKYFKHFAYRKHSGVAAFNKKYLKQDIKNLRKQGAQHILVSIHWGKNYEQVSRRQKKEARIMINAGVDVIVGHGSHDYQRIGTIKNKTIFYSVGNFCFGTPGRPHFKYGFPVTLYFNENGLQNAEIHPLITQNRMAYFQPLLLNGNMASMALNELKQKSELPTDMIIFDNRGSLIFK